MWEKFKNFRILFFRVDSRTIYLYSFIIGCMTGLGAILFYYTIHGLSHWFFDQAAQFNPTTTSSRFGPMALGGMQPRDLLVLLIPALGGLMVGLITRFWGPEAKGTGVDFLLDSFHNRSGQMRKRTPFVKFAASACTLSTGGSAGKEGPMALIGAGLGSLLGRWIKMGARAKRTLLLAGSAGGLGAIFRSPLGGAITAVEVLYKEDFEADALLPCIIASVTAYTIFSTVVGFGHILNFEANLFTSPIQLIFYVFLGLFCSGASFLFIWLFRNVRTHLFRRLKIPAYWKPALGGLMVGVFALLIPQAVGEGVGVIQSVILAEYPSHWLGAALFLLALAVMKMLTTTLTVQSGGSGGVLIPSLFIGAMLGGFFGLVCHHFFPTYVPDVTPFIVVGMAAFFSSVTNASLGALVMVTEMTGGYELLPPLMVVGVISLITSHRWSIYRNQVNNKFSSQAHLWDMNPMNLKPVTIGNAFREKYHQRAIISNHLSLRAIEAITQETHATDFLVKTGDDILVGLLSLRDLSQVDDDLNASKELLIAEDLISRPKFYLTEKNTLYEALKFLMDSDFDKVPVVNLQKDVPHLLGYLRHQDILEFYFRMGLQRTSPAPVKS